MEKIQIFISLLFECLEREMKWKVTFFGELNGKE